MLSSERPSGDPRPTTIRNQRLDSIPSLADLVAGNEKIDSSQSGGRDVPGAGISSGPRSLDLAAEIIQQTGCSKSVETGIEPAVAQRLAEHRVQVPAAVPAGTRLVL